ncbi:MAG TPA: tyrosine-type recombinase/integrase [Ktedonobacteraceae bacterium]
MIARTFVEPSEEIQARPYEYTRFSSGELDSDSGSAIEAWLQQSYPPSSGETTTAIYRQILVSFCLYLQAQGLDMWSPASQLTPHIQNWVGLRTATSRRQGRIAHSTYNQRIAALRSFYAWAGKNAHAGSSNPAERIRNVTVDKYASVRPLDARQVAARLRAIDRSTIRGQRDYALLQVALNTGRSARELSGLTWGNLSLDGEHVTLIFQGGRSKKVLCDLLDSRLSQVLLTYLRTAYRQDLASLDLQAPIWISFSDRTAGQAIGQQTIADICATHLGISQFQRLRDTFALTMDQLGAQIETIQSCLDHASRATTGTYLANLKRAHNPHAGGLADAFGVE